MRDGIAVLNKPGSLAFPQDLNSETALLNPPHDIGLTKARRSLQHPQDRFPLPKL